MTDVQTGREFSIIGENVHATRVLVRGGPGTGNDEQGREAIRFVDMDGQDIAGPCEC